MACPAPADPQAPPAAPPSPAPAEPPKPHWARDPMFWATMIGSLAVFATLIYTIIASRTTDKKIDALVQSTQSLASAGWAQVGKGEKQVQAIGALKDTTSDLSDHTGGIETATNNFSKATSRQADYTAQLVSTNSDSYTSVQRAFVNVQEVEAVQVPGLSPGIGGQPNKPTPYWRFRPIIVNDGNTPTRNLRFFAQSSFNELGQPVAISGKQGISFPFQSLLRDTPLDPDDLKLQATPEQLGKTVLGARASTPIAGVGVTEEFLNHAAGLGFYVFGEIAYEDVFPKSKPHVTKYCYVVHGIPSVGDHKPDVGLCGHWNCADDECKQDRKDYDNEVRAAKAQGQTLPPQVLEVPQVK